MILPAAAVFALPDFLKEAPAALRRTFAEEATDFRLPAGRQILSPGQACTGMAFIVSGCVRIYLLGKAGREITLYRVAAGQSCLLTASCILGSTGFPASAVVESDVAGFSVSAERLRTWVGHDVYWREYVFRLIGERMATVLSRFEEAAFDPLEARLARLLDGRLAASQRWIETTHQQLADELGSAREVVSRALERWQAEGWVRLHRGTIEILQRQEIRRAAAPV